MITLLTILHVVFCLFLILVILLQTGKGAGMGAAFGGGGSSTVFGPRGAGSFIGKTTGVVAVLFMLTSLSLAFLSSSSSSSLEDKAALLDENTKGEDVDLGALSGSSESTPAPEEEPAATPPADAEDAGQKGDAATPAEADDASDASPA